MEEPRHTGPTHGLEARPPRGRQGSGNELKVILRSARESYNHRWRGKEKKFGRSGLVSRGLVCLAPGVGGPSPRVFARTPCHGLGLKFTDVDLNAWMPMTMRCISDFGRYRRYNQCFPSPWVVYQIANLKHKSRSPARPVSFLLGYRLADMVSPRNTHGGG